LVLDNGCLLCSEMIAIPSTQLQYGRAPSRDS
jgi:hypothetical protein